jgi:hypothetical protein
MKKRITLIPVCLTAFMPLVAAAATVQDIVTVLSEIVGLVIPLLSVIAIAIFLYGVVKYITAGGDAEKEKQARGYLIYGLIGLFVLVAFWALVTVLTSTFGLEEGVAPVNPSADPVVGG